MSSYVPPSNIGTAFNVSDYNKASSDALTIAVANKLYAKLNGFNTYLGANSFFNIVSLNGNSLFMNNGNNQRTASINADGIGNFTNLQIGGVNLTTLFAPLDSPHFTGTPTSVQPADTDSTNMIATCSYVRNNINALIGGAPAFLDTLNEIANAIANDPEFSVTILNLIATKQNIINSNNKLNAAYVGNGDVSNTVLSYIKNVTSDVQSSFNTLNTTVTGISYSNGTTTLNNALNINRKQLYLSDITGANSNYEGIYYSGQNFYMANSGGSNSNTIFRFFTTNPASFVDSVTITGTGISTINLSASGLLSMNGGATLASGQLFTLLGNIYANGKTINPQNIGYLDRLGHNVEDTLVSHENSISALNQKTTNIFYDNSTNCTSIVGITTTAAFSVNNNAAVGGVMVVGQNLNIGGDIVLGGKIFTKNQSTNYRVGFLYVGGMSLPLIRTINNTSIAFGGLDLRSMIGPTGFGTSVMVYPQYKIDFCYTVNVMQSIDNTSGTDMLYSTLDFSMGRSCQSINCYFDGVLI